MKKVILLLIFILFLSPFVAVGGEKDVLPFDSGAIGRVVWDKHTCTGFIFATEEVRSRNIWGAYARNWVATAGHCAKEAPNNATFITKPVRKKLAEGVVMNYPSSSFSLFLVGFSEPREVGIYYFYSLFPYPTILPNYSPNLQVGERVWVAGYGRRVWMVYPAHYVGTENGWLLFQDTLWFGFSGSPVINTRGEVVGIVWGIIVDNPLACMWGECKRKNNIFYASPVSNILGIIKGR